MKKEKYDKALMSGIEAFLELRDTGLLEYLGWITSPAKDEQKNKKKKYWNKK